MKRLIIGLIILIVLLAGGFAAAVVTLNSIDWSEYEEPIAEAVKDATGRELRFSGALNVNISLSPGISAKGVTLQNADWASRDTMFSLEHAEAHLKLLPLIFGRIELSRLEIIGLDLLLETDQQGKGNWEFDLAGADVSADTETSSDDKSLLTAAVLTRAVIRNATVVYKDGETGETQRLGIAELTAHMDSMKAPLVIDMEGVYGEESVELSGRLDGIKDLLAGGALGVDLSATALGAKVAIDGVINRPLEADGIEIAVDASGDSLSRLAEFADVQLAELGTYRVAANITGNTESMAVTGLDAALEAAGAQVRVTGRISDVMAVTGVDVALNVTGDSLANLSSLAETELPDLGSFRFVANVTGTAEQFSMTNLSIGIADMQITGNLKADIGGELMRLEAMLNSPKIDLTLLMPEEEATALSSGSQQDNSGERVFPNDPLPLDTFDMLETMDAVVDLSIGELIVDSETTVKNLEVRVTAAPKKVTFAPLKLEAMGASINGRVGVEAMQSKAAVDAKLKITHPTIGDLVMDDSSKMMSGGPLDLDVDISGSGASVRDIMASANGFMNVELGAARANSKWMQLAFAEIEAILTKKARVPRKDKPVELNCVVADFKIKEGIAATENFVVDARGISLFGGGTVDLRTESLSLNFDWLAAGISEKTAMPTFKARGTLMSPSGKFDTKKLIGGALGFGDGAVTESDFEGPELTAKTGPERCRQRLLVYERVREERARPKEVTVDSVLKDVDTAKETLKKFRGLIKKKD